MDTTPNVLALPFRRSVNLSLADSIRPLIDSKYGQHPDQFLNDLEIIDLRRREAVHVEAHESAIKKLQAYIAQLAWLAGKFPIDIDAYFTWYPSLGYDTDRPIVRNNLKFELINVLFNLGAVYSQLASGCPTSTTNGIKTAANYFSQAAGVLSYIQKEVLPNLRMSDPPDDLNVATLESLTQLCLAQSQECFWHKAVLDGYKDASISKLAARVSDLFRDAADAAVKSEVISSTWIHHMGAKHNHFAAAAQYRMARECLEKKQYGEEIARLRDAIVCVEQGLKSVKGSGISKSVLDDLNFVKKRIEDDLKRAEKDNDNIYLDSVPSKAELTILDRVNMVTAKVPRQVSHPLDFLGDDLEFGPPLFAKLVPYSVHNAVAVYEERRNRLLNINIIQELESLNIQMRELLGSLNLPGSLQALEKPLGLPHNTVQHAEELRRAEGVTGLDRVFRDLESLRSENIKQYNEGKTILETEAEEDSRLRSKYGTDRWTRPNGIQDPQGQTLYAKADEIQGYIDHSGGSDLIIRQRLASIIDTLAILCSTDRVLMDFVPSSRAIEMPDTLKAATGQLRRSYNDSLRLETRRSKKINALHDLHRRDDVRPDILREAARLERAFPSINLSPAHFEEFFDCRLEHVYKEDLYTVEREKSEQDKVLGEVQRASAEFESQKRRVAGGQGREREKALQKLEDAWRAYKEIRHNLSLARNFYNDLLKITGNGFLVLVRGWVNDRRADAKELEQEMSSLPNLSALSLKQQQTSTHFAPQLPHPSQSATPSHRMAEAEIQSWSDVINTVGGAKTSAMAAPTAMDMRQGPVRNQAWTSTMGIRFAPTTSLTTNETGGDDKKVDNNDVERKPSGPWDPSVGIRFS